jgi:hypothetical protein
VRGQCPDAEALSFERHVAQPRDAPDVDERCGARQSEVHHRDKALTARNELGVLAESVQQVDRFFNGRGTVVLEATRLYEALLKDRPRRALRIVVARRS